MGTIENCGIPLALFHTGIKSLTPFEKHRAEKGVVSQVRANKSGIALSPNRVTYARRAVAKSNLSDKSGHEINSYTIFFFFFFPPFIISTPSRVSKRVPSMGKIVITRLSFNWPVFFLFF